MKYRTGNWARSSPALAEELVNRLRDLPAVVENLPEVDVSPDLFDNPLPIRRHHRR